MGMGAATSLDGTTIGYTSVGRGEPVLIVGGALRSAEDYMPLARELAGRFEVHVVDRRGRGLSGPFGDHYSMLTECEDLRAVQRATGATMAFGHSYGGLVVLEAAAVGLIFSRIALYEPAVSVAGSIPTMWLKRYAELLDAHDPRGAFAEFVRQSGHAPAVVSRMPTWYLRFVLRMAVRRRRWRTMEPLLAANAVEHTEVAKLENGSARYRSITSPVLLLAGARSPRPQTEVLRDLAEIMPDAMLEVIKGLDHNAPDEKAPAVVATRLRVAFDGTSPRRRERAR
jgi:pimeloyl-ACP methyl ester carboxylesterase